MAAISAGAAAKAAAALLKNEKTRKGIGWIIVAAFSPVILLAVILFSFMQGGSQHNIDAVRLCFYGGTPPAHTPDDYAVYISDMRDSFALLDKAIEEVNELAEDEMPDTVRIKSVFYSLYFGLDSPSKRDHRKFVDCFVSYEERTREIQVPVEKEDEDDFDSEENSNTEKDNSDSNSKNDAEDDDDEPEYITVIETYIVTVPIKSLAVVYDNIANSVGIHATHEQKTNAQEIYYLISYGETAPDGANLDNWLNGMYDPEAPFVGADGFTSPVGGNWRNMVTSEFGSRVHPISGEISKHKGIDLASFEGSPIYAALDGKVIYVRVGGGSSYGKHLAIDHGGGIVTLYAHNSDIFVSEGQYVTAGQQIAAMGKTGQVTGVHLHFEVRDNGNFVNPRSYLP